MFLNQLCKSQLNQKYFNKTSLNLKIDNEKNAPMASSNIVHILSHSLLNNLVQTRDQQVHSLCATCLVNASGFITNISSLAARGLLSNLLHLFALYRECDSEDERTVYLAVIKLYLLVVQKMLRRFPTNPLMAIEVLNFENNFIQNIDDEEVASATECILKFLIAVRAQLSAESIFNITKEAIVEYVDRKHSQIFDGTKGKQLTLVLGPNFPLINRLAWERVDKFSELKIGTFLSGYLK